MTRTVALLAALVVGVAPTAFAQAASITGMVVDDRTGQPLKGVLVYVESQAAFGESDASGQFTLTVPGGKHTVVASLIGYAIAKVDLTATGSTPLTIRLSEGAGNYTEKVTVIGTADQPADEAPGGGALFGRELQNLRGVMLDDPLRAIQALPSATATDDFYGEFAVRGNSFRHINLTVDGIASKYLMHTVNDIVDGGSITMVNAETLGAVVLLPGSYPQKSGRHIGAEVDMLTRDGSRDRFHGRAGLSGTSATFLGEGPLPDGRGSWLASVRRSYLDYLIKRIDPTAGFAFGFVDAQGKLTFDLTPKHQLQWTTIVGRAAFDGEDSDDLNDTASAASHSWFSALSWRYTPRAGVSITNRVFSTGLDFDNRNPFDTTLDAARFTNFGWRADASVLVAPFAVAEFGGDAQILSGRHTRLAAPPGGTSLVNFGDYDEHASTASAYAQVRLALARLTITPGIRGDHWSMTSATTASPWVTADVRVGPRTRLRGGTGIYRQFAEFDQVFGLNGGGRNLTAERALHVDAGIEQTLFASTTLQFTAFLRRESNVLWPAGHETRLVGNRIVGGLFDAEWKNALNGRASGGEIVLRRDAAAGLSGWAGYAYGRLRYDRPGGNESFWADADQRHTVSLYGHYRLSSRSSLSAKYRYGSNYPVAGYLTDAPGAPIDPDTDGPSYYQLTGVRNTTRLRPYSRLDVRADRAFTWGSRRVVLFVEVANVQNRKNLRNTPYGVDRSGRAFGVNETMMPIIPSAGFVVEF